MYRDLISLQNSLCLDPEGPRFLLPVPVRRNHDLPTIRSTPLLCIFGERGARFIRCFVGPCSQRPDWQVHVLRSVKLPHRQKSRENGF